ncbi:MAG: 30S ribosomal protein S17e [Candidatus Aenigmarchaeota archaeon]|nr:30S ribosomal protein S17e [Candidatus Aenigmarchaeota archaeon]
MGRIKTIFIKRVGRELFEANPEAFSNDYAANKKVVKSMTVSSSRKNLNVVTGYVTSLKKQKRL